MDRKDLEVLSRFEAVWQRVQQGREEQTEAEDRGLEELMDGLYYCMEGCRQLAACTAGTERNCLLTLSHRMKNRISGLQLAYFLEEGDLYTTCKTPNFASYTPYNLRKLWRATVENAETAKKCNLYCSVAFIAELQEVEAELQCQKLQLERLLKRLFQ